MVKSCHRRKKSKTDYIPKSIRNSRNGFKTKSSKALIYDPPHYALRSQGPQLPYLPQSQWKTEYTEEFKNDIKSYNEPPDPYWEDRF